MTNNQMIQEYVNGNRTFHGANHLLIDGATLYNYSTALCILDRATKKARFNNNKYSSTTSKIQSMLYSELIKAGFTVEETSDFRFGGWWNYGYQGAQVYSAEGSTRW